MDNRSSKYSGFVRFKSAIQMIFGDEPFANLADIKKAKKLLDWEPTTDLISWIKNYKKTKGLK